jgi:hypothetical protein
MQRGKKSTKCKPRIFPGKYQKESCKKQLRCTLLETKKREQTQILSWISGKQLGFSRLAKKKSTNVDQSGIPSELNSEKLLYSGFTRLAKKKST